MRPHRISLIIGLGFTALVAYFYNQYHQQQVLDQKLRTIYTEKASVDGQ